MVLYPTVADEGAVPIIPFNLRSDREEGYFDEEGNYVFKKEEDEDANDAWLAAEAGGRQTGQAASHSHDASHHPTGHLLYAAGRRLANCPALKTY